MLFNSSCTNFQQNRAKPQKVWSVFFHFSMEKKLTVAVRQALVYSNLIGVLQR